MERDLPGRFDQLGVEMRERLQWDIRESIVGSENFIPKHSVIVTWKNVTFVGGWISQEIVRFSKSPFYILKIDKVFHLTFQTNTFQAVIVTDEGKKFYFPFFI